MAYIGNQLAQSYISFAKQDFTTSATTAYTLDYPVANENEIALFINFVRQEPTTAYTASGTSLTLTSATSASDDMYAIFIGKAVQTVTPPAGSVDSSKINYPLTTFSSTGIDDNATSTAITIDSSEQVGIGTTSLQPFLVNASRGSGMGSYPTWEATTGRNLALFETDQSEGTFVLGSPTNGYAQLGFADPSHKSSGRIGYDHSSDTMTFGTNSGAERMRIDSSGNVLIAKTSTSDTVTGTQITPNGNLINVYNASGYSIQNRQDDDGVFIYFKQANSTEGNIAVSGATVSYNGFTGTHWTRLADNSKPNILKGTVLETLDEMVDWYNLEFDVTTQDEDGNDVTTIEKIPHVLAAGQSVGDTVTYNHKGTDYQATIVREADIKHMKSKVSDTTDAKNVYGVFSHWDFGDDDGINDIIVASVGSFVVRIKSGETVAKGDLLQSNGDGTAKVQSDDAIRASTFAKVLSTTVIETYEDGSYLVPCSLMC